MSNTTPSGTDAPAVQSVASSSHPMVTPSLLTSSPALISSDPSIHAGRRRSRPVQVLLILLAAVALLCLVWAIFISINTIRDNKVSAQKEEQLAHEIKHVAAQAVRGGSDGAEEDAAAGDDNRIYLNISSIPSGADVYLDGLYIGRTDDEKALEKRIAKSESNSQLIVARSGYLVAKKTFSRGNDFSDTVTLEEIPVVQAAEKKPKSGDVTVNKAKVVGVPAAREAKKSGKKGTQTIVAEESGIILPD